MYSALVICVSPNRLSEGVSPRRSLLSSATNCTKKTSRKTKEEIQQLDKHQTEDMMQIEEEERTDEAGEESMQHEQQSSQLMATLVEDLAMSESDDGGNEVAATDVHPVVTAELATTGMQLPCSDAQQQLLIRSKPSCARCIIFNPAATAKRRKRNVIKLFCNKGNNIEDLGILEIVVPRKKQPPLKSLQRCLNRLEKSNEKVQSTKADMEPANCSHIPQVVPSSSSKLVVEENTSLLCTPAKGRPEISFDDIIEVVESGKVIKTEDPAECNHVPLHHPIPSSSDEQVGERNVMARNVPAESTTEINANNFVEGVESAKVKTEEVDIKLDECSYIPQHHLVSSNSDEHVAQVNAPAEDTTELSTDNIIEEALRITMMDFSADQQSTDDLNNTKSSVQLTSPAVCRVPPRARRKRNLSPDPVKKKSCVVDLRSVKKPSTSESDSNPFIRSGKINLSRLKTSRPSNNDESLKEIIRQKNLTVSLVKLTTAELPAKRHWPSTKSPSVLQLAAESVGRNEENFTFNLDKVVSKAAKQFSFTVASTKTTNKGPQAPRTETVFERLGEQVNPFIADSPINRPKTPPIDIPVTPSTEDPMSPIKPRTPCSLPQSDLQEEDILEIHPLEDFVDEVSTEVLLPSNFAVSKKAAPSKECKLPVQTPIVTTTGVQRTVRITPIQRSAVPAQQAALSQQVPAANTLMPAASKQRLAPVHDSIPGQHWKVKIPPPTRQFDKQPPQPYKHEQVSQWVNNTRSNPPPPPPGYLTPSEGSGAAIFSFPSNSSPVPTPATTPPHCLEEEFDSISVHQNGNDRKSTPSLPWPPRREPLASNGFMPLSFSEPPKGLCFKYWKTSSCPQMRTCKFLHVRNPEV